MKDWHSAEMKSDEDVVKKIVIVVARLRDDVSANGKLQKLTHLSSIHVTV